jgi:NAD(P)-dependent dehydrogenase (short-subunit alcohol dehydrogenase family)
MRIAVIDGQGGGIGKSIVERIKCAGFSNVTVLALGTNAVATGQMMKGGADEGATGENAIIYNLDYVDVIVGVVGILAANSMLGELTPSMATAIGSSKAHKILLPLNRCGIQVTGVVDSNLNTYIDDMIKAIKEKIR